MHQNHNNDFDKTFLEKIKNLFLDVKYQWLFFLLLGLVVGYFFNESQQIKFELPKWAIIEGIDLKETPEEATDIFNTRVQVEFFKGLEEKFLIRELRQAGFRLDWYSSGNPKMAYHRKWEDKKCREVRTISWETDKNKILLTASGSLWRKCKRD